MRSRKRVLAAGVASAAGLLVACAGGAPAPRAPLEPLPTLAAAMPDAADRTARDIARALWQNDAPAVAAHITELRARAGANHVAESREHTGENRITESHEHADANRVAELRARADESRAAELLPYALDAEIALIKDTRARRRASETLLQRDDLPLSLRARLEIEAADDPLKLARQRLRDGRVRRYGSIANALASGLGTQLQNTALLPLRMTRVLLRIALREHHSLELSTAERQALEHWKRFVAQNPDSEEALALLTRIEIGQARWLETKREQNARAARVALESGRAALAEHLAARALRYASDDAETRELLARAREQREHEQHARAQTLKAAPDALSQYAHAEDSVLQDASAASEVPRAQTSARASDAERVLAAEGTLLRLLWLPETTPQEVADAARALLNAAPSGARADEARFVLALADAEAGREVESWDALAALARAEGARSNMARHARALVHSLDANPYGGFRAARAAERGKRARWLAFGPLASGARDQDLPRTLEWLVEVPSAPAVVLGLPQRLVQFPFLPTFSRAPDVLARRYLARAPEGAHAGEVRAWLIAHAQQRENHVGAWQLARAHPDYDADALEALRERASVAAFQTARAERRRDARLSLLRDVAQNFPETEGGRDAGLALRDELKNWSPQRIRISRAFLKAQRSVSGPRGLALRTQLLDGVLANGELHPDGVALLGERTIELAFVAASGDERAAPLLQRQRISKERLARTVAQLEESAQHWVRTDADLRPEHDAHRDTYLERARLGAVERPDLRGAGSSYHYRTPRERFGLVRGRESLLPVELVLQGSFDDFGLGAFPRLRLPRHTPDSVLYE